MIKPCLPKREWQNPQWQCGFAFQWTSVGTLDSNRCHDLQQEMCHKQLTVISEICPLIDMPKWKPCRLRIHPFLSNLRELLFFFLFMLSFSTGPLSHPFWAPPPTPGCCSLKHARPRSDICHFLQCLSWGRSYRGFLVRCPSETQAADRQMHVALLLVVNPPRQRKRLLSIQLCRRKSWGRSSGELTSAGQTLERLVQCTCRARGSRDEGADMTSYASCKVFKTSVK